MRSYNIQPKPTLYNGVEFRSRLEARWAIFFDAIKVKWEYERAYQQVSDTEWYMPDFWLSTGWIVEIKPTPPIESEYVKARAYRGKIAIISGIPSTYAQLWLMDNGQIVDIQLSRLEQARCFVSGLSMWQWLNLKKLAEVTGKRDFNRAFVKAGSYRFG